jgi:hypothetical protein
MHWSQCPSEEAGEVPHQSFAFLGKGRRFAYAFDKHHKGIFFKLLTLKVEGQVVNHTY